MANQIFPISDTLLDLAEQLKTLALKVRAMEEEILKVGAENRSLKEKLHHAKRSISILLNAGKQLSETFDTIRKNRKLEIIPDVETQPESKDLQFQGTNQREIPDIEREIKQLIDRGNEELIKPKTEVPRRPF